jgi:hypothetical protein
MDQGLLLALVGLTVAGVASLLGIWMERDPTRPPRWAIGLSILIAATTVVSCFQSISDAQESAKMEEDLARMLQTLDKIATESGGEGGALNDFISKEMESQSRANPDVIKKVADRVTAEGGDPNALLGRHLPASELGGFPDAKAAAPPAVSEETKKLRAEAANLKKELAAAKASSADGEAAKKAADKAKQEKEEADKKIEELNKQVELLKKQNEKIKGKTTGGSRWEKG